MQMFEKDEVSQELAARLKAAGIAPTDPMVRAITDIVSGYFAERTAEVLKKVRDVLDQVRKEDLN